ncbi:neuropeptide prohormone-4-like [Babylonia areolata]|uniref:neuropeptide prohormone-4-like n=1 Tax=Babylonia areolata TaxID=304850 RepID=UPI003FD01960
MSSSLRLEATVLVAAILVTCSHGLKIDFSRLSLPSRSFLHTGKRSTCQGNPCDPSTPFLCRDSPTCIRLVDICDGKWDCEGGFDEDPAVCNAASRPPFDSLYKFLDDHKQWIIPKLFNGADPEMVAHELTVADNLESLQHHLGLTDANVENIRKAFIAAVEGDERPILKMGMPERAWPEVKFLFETLLESGFHV